MNEMHQQHYIKKSVIYRQEEIHYEEVFYLTFLIGI